MKKRNNILKVLIISISALALSACTSPKTSTNALPDTVTPAENVSGVNGSSDDTNSSNEGSASAGETSADDASSSDNTTDVSTNDEADASASAATSTTVYRDPISPQEPVKDGYLNLVFLGDEQFLTGASEGNTIPDLMANRFDYVEVYNLAIKDTMGAIPRSQTSTDLSAYKEPGFTAMAHVLAGDIKISSFGDKVSQNAIDACSKVNVKTVDYYVIGYGYHDYYNGIEAKNESNPEDEHSLYGAIVTGIKILQKVSPNAQFIICSPYYCRFFDDEGNDIGDAFSVTKGLTTLAVYANETMLAAEGSTNALKLPAISGTLFDLNGHTYSQYLESDCLTMNIKGRRIYSDALARVIKYHLGFIGEEEANKTITIADYN